MRVSKVYNIYSTEMGHSGEDEWEICDHKLRTVALCGQFQIYKNQVSDFVSIWIIRNFFLLSSNGPVRKRFSSS